MLTITNSIATITIPRPEKLNAFTRETTIQFQHALDECAANQTIRVVKITGSGTAFSAGQDLAEVTAPSHPGFGRILSEQYNPIIKKITGLAKPVVAAVNGVAAGAGANIALCCDIVIAKRSASFIQAFSKIGLIPDSGGTFFLPRLIGWQKASALMMLGDKVSADEAERIGMIYRSVEDDAFEKVVLEICEKLAATPPVALSGIKKVLQSSLQNNLHQQLIEEDELQQQAAATDDFARLAKAFTEKKR